MGGPAKGRHPSDTKGPNSSKGSSSASRDPTQRSISRLDGNRDPTMSGVQSYTRPMDLKNLSEFLGVSGWYTARGESIPQALPQRPKAFNSNGKEVVIKLNTFNVLKSPSTVVYQYDVAFRGDANDYSKRALISKIWHSKAVKQALGEPGERWIYDYNKLAWSTKRLERDDETRIKADLDAEEERKPKPGARGNIHTVILRRTRHVDFSGLQSFLAGQASWSEQCIDTINFLDHLMREGPTQNYTQIKKSFFQRGQQRFDLGGGVEAFKGVFASLRPVLNDNFQKSLAVNVDVANGTFWRAQELGRAILQVFNFSSPAQLAQHFKQAKSKWRDSLMKKDLRTLRRVGVITTHLEKPVRWVIDDFADKDVDEATFTRDGKKITVSQYFREHYKINCLKGVPVVKMTKKIRGESVYLPVDVLKIEENQRYNSKLSDRQTSEMIKFAVTLPQKRWEAVQEGVQLLNWRNDPYLKHYGLQITDQASRVKGRILPPPTVNFGQGSKEATIKPMDLQNGRWRLDGRRFAMNNSNRPIKAWGVCCIQGRGAPPPPAVEAFVQKFVQVYESHGGQILAHPQHGKKPWIGPGNLSDGGELVSKVWNQTGNRYNMQPNLLLFIVTDRNVDVYRRIKKSCDIRFGIASQVMQAKHVVSASPQYISNVCMKVNAKLGGATTVVRSNVIPKVAPKSGAIPTMVVGADVSHPAPGAGSVDAASFAAITVSADVNYARYWAEVQTNGHRIEMVTSANIDNHFGNMAKLWMQRIGQGQPPKRVLYLRDGVSEGQYQQVLEEEVRDMKECFKKLGCKEVPKFTVVISGKRHHIRFFPEKGDRNGNPLPGTLVESGCTHPFEFDFYLCSHVAIKGTARPIHYHCILNEGEWHAQELQSFIFDHAFQYVRSTTPVSQHPAVYYAHLAADRARAHVNDSPISSGKKESKAEQQTTTGSSSKNIDVPPLMPMLNSRGLKEVMWYI